MVPTPCPNCGSPDHHIVVWGTRNVSVVVANTLLFVIAFGAIGFVPSKGFSLKHKCLNCGYRFLGRRPLVPDFDECPKCGYNLTGNVSSRCSECGWRLTLRYRAYRRKTDRQHTANRPDDKCTVSESRPKSPRDT